MKILTSTSLLRSTRLTASFTASVGDVTLSGHRLEVACQCGVTFERWITLLDAIDDLREHLLAKELTRLPGRPLSFLT